MIVYRLEKNGVGPFMQRTYGFRTYKKTRTHQIYKNRLNEAWKTIQGSTAVAWDKAHNDPRYMFGCPSKEYLRMYFGGAFKPYFEKGYRIKRYRVPDDKVLNMGLEVAFPVRYHKFGTKKNIKKALRKETP